LLQLIGLPAEEYGWKFPSQLSGGEAQRVGVARALGADPPILLLDEPFGAVDPLKREELQDEFVRIQRRLKKTVIFVTHDLDEAVRLADLLVIMKDGKILQAGNPDDLLASPNSDFVADFLGSDRALKRLTLFTADRIMKSPSTLEHDQGTLSGLYPHSSLKECMSRILALGTPSVLIHDDHQQLVGVVHFEDIQRISFEKR
jgi:osmoprotectant transport system ATP-binding protein